MIAKAVFSTLYHLAPIWMGQHAINGFLKQQGIRRGLIPAACRRDLARDAYSMTNMLTKEWTTANKVARFTDSLELRAFQVVSLFTMADRNSPFLRDAARTRFILERHGVRPPP